MRAFSYLCGHFRSRDQDGGYTICSAIFENPMLHANFMALCFIEPELLPIKFYIVEYGFFIFVAPVTWTWWPTYTNLTRIPSRYTGCANMSFLHKDFWKLSSDRHTYINADRQTNRHAEPKFYIMLQWSIITTKINLLIINWFTKWVS